DGSLLAKPVTLPVGRAKFVTKPLPIGSPTPINKCGTVRTSASRIPVTKLELATIRFGFRSINSMARARVWLYHWWRIEHQFRYCVPESTPASEVPLEMPQRVTARQVPSL